MPPQISKLPNGLTVVSDPMSHIETAAIGVWVDAGARNETPSTNGIAHMLEHMAFKGTHRRSAKDIAEQIERVGGFINAYTGREQTAYYARVLKADVELAIDILADILLESVFDPEELEREKGVVLQEIGQAEDTPDDIIFDHLQAQAFPDQPLGRPILGSEALVRSFTRDKLQTQIEQHYLAPNMYLIASGAVEHSKIVQLATQYFGRAKSGASPSVDSGLYRGGEFRETGDLEQAHIALAFPGFRATDEDIFAVQVYSTVLGGGMSSRLFQEAREKRGLCYSIHAFGSSYRDIGLFGIYAGTSAQDAKELVRVIAGEMKSLAVSTNEDEVLRARAQIKSGLLMGLEQASARCEHIASQMLTYGQLFEPQELVAKIDAVDSRTVSRIAGKVLSNGALSFAGLGPLGGIGSYDQLENGFR